MSNMSWPIPKSVDFHRHRAWLSSHFEANAPHARWHHGLRGSRAKAEHLEVVRQLNVHLKVGSGITIGQPRVNYGLIMDNYGR